MMVYYKATSFVSIVKTAKIKIIPKETSKIIITTVKPRGQVNLLLDAPSRTFRNQVLPPPHCSIWPPTTNEEIRRPNRTMKCSTREAQMVNTAIGFPPPQLGPHRAKTLWCPSHYCPQQQGKLSQAPSGNSEWQIPRDRGNGTARCNSQVIKPASNACPRPPTFGILWRSRKIIIVVQANGWAFRRWALR